MSINLFYDKSKITTQDELHVSVADLRDVVGAFSIPDEQQRVHELQVILRSIMRKNKLPYDSLAVG